MIDPATLLERLGIEWRPRGHRLIAPCPSPDHPDRKPSWAAWSDDLGRFRHRCLACGFGGGPARLVQARLACNIREAYDFLEGAESAGPPPPPTIRVEVREPSRAIADVVPEEVWFEPFDEWPTPARRYLEKRRMGKREVDKWGLGYAVDGHLRGRIWIPVRNVAGELSSWTARSYDDSDPKYDSSRVAASGVLFGECFWRDGWMPGSWRHTVVVVEGPFDAIAVEAAIPGASVAALRGSASAGQAIDPAQAGKLARFGHVIVATDPDKAGKRAASLLAGLGRWTKVTTIALFAGMDCAKLYETGGASALASALMEDRSSMRQTGWG